MEWIIWINGVNYTYETLPRQEMRYVALMDLPNFEKWKVYKGKRDWGDFFMKWDNCDYVLFFDKDIHDYFITERQYLLKAKII